MHTCQERRLTHRVTCGAVVVTAAVWNTVSVSERTSNVMRGLDTGQYVKTLIISHLPVLHCRLAESIDSAIHTNAPGLAAAQRLQVEHVCDSIVENQLTGDCRFTPMDRR